MTSSSRDRILEAALALFVAQGVAATRTEEICKRAGVSNGSLFHFFAGKEAIAVALYVEAISSYQSTLLRELAERRETAATLRAVVAAHWRWIAANETRAKLLFRQGAPHWHPDAARDTAELNANAAAALREWRDAPAHRADLHDIPEDAFMPILLGPSMMATRGWLRAPGAAPPTALAECFADAAVHSLLRKEPR